MSGSLKKGSIFLFTSSIFFLLTGYLTNVWLGRYLGPNEYGIYGVVISIMSLVNLVQSYGVPQSVSKYVSSHNEADSVLRSGLLTQLILGIIISIVFFVLSWPLSYIFKDRNLLFYLQLSALIFPFNGIYSLYLGFYNGLHNFKKQAIIDITYSLSKCVLIIIFVLLFGITGAIIGFIISSILATIVGLKLPNKSNISFPFRTLIVFSVPILLFSILINLSFTIDLFFTKNILGNNTLTGYYIATQNVAKIPYFAVNGISSILLPSISKNISLNLFQKSRDLISNFLRLLLLFLIPGTLLIAATGPQIIKILYSNLYLPAASSLTVLAFGMAFLTIFSILANIINGSGHPKTSLYVSLLGVIITIILCLVLIPKYELVGAALSTTIGACVSMVVSAAVVYKQFQVLVSFSSIIKISTSSLVIFLLAKSFTPPLLFLPIYYFVLLGIYGGLLILLREITRKDWDQVKTIIPSWVPLVKKENIYENL